MLRKLIRGYISFKCGDSVARQFQATFDCEDTFENQNESALIYISEMVYQLLDVDLLSEDSQEELREYYESLEHFLND